MKKLLLLALTAMMMVGCDTEMPDGTYRPVEGSCKTYVIDSCEYFGLLDLGNANFLSHKGNCKFCAERRKQELKELVEQLKDK